MKNKIIGIVLALIISLLPSITIIASEEIEETFISEEYQEYVYEISNYYIICPELVMAIIESESSGKANVKNGNCKCLMQINEPCHKDRIKRLGVTDIYEPYGNILVGVDYLSELFEMYEDVGLVLMIYNGSSKAKSFAERGILTNYASKILERSEELEMLHEQKYKEGILNYENNKSCY